MVEMVERVERVEMVEIVELLKKPVICEIRGRFQHWKLIHLSTLILPTLTKI